MSDNYPVLVETTERHLVWVEADNQEAAVALLNDDSEWYEAISPETRIEDGADYTIKAVEDYDWEFVVYPYSRVEGPREACGECGSVSHNVRWKPWHTEQCSQHTTTPGLRRVEDVELPEGATA